MSEKLPVAANWRVEPTPIVGDTGVTEMDASDFTVIVVVPETPRVAVMEVEPVATAVATPCEAGLLLMVAIPLFEELQTTKDDKSCTDPSGKEPTAVNFWVDPATTLGLAGVTAIDTGPCAVIAAVPETPAKAAVTVVEPFEREEAIPLELIVATPVLDEFQVTSDVIFWVVLFDNVPVAENC